MRINFHNPDNDIDNYINHEEQTHEEICFQLGFKPAPEEYFGEGYTISTPCQGS